MSLGQWLGLLAIASAFYILWQIRQLVLLAFTAVVLATAINSLVRRCERLNLKRGQALLVTLSAIVLVMIVFFALVFPPFVDQFQKLVKLAPKGISQVRETAPAVIDQLGNWVPPSLGQVKEFLDLIKSFLQGGTPTTTLPSGPPNYALDFSNLPQQLTPIFRNFFAVFNNALGATVQVLFVILLTLMLLANPRAYREALLLLFPSFYRRRADEILTKCEVALTNWFSGILLSSTGIAVLSGGGLALLGIDLALAHGLLAGLLNLIPNIGPTLSMVFPISVALLGPLWKVGAVVVLYLVVQNIESYLLTPTVMAHQVSLLPALTLLAQIFFASVFGVLGLLLALPLTVVAKVWLQECLIRDILDQQGDGTTARRGTLPKPLDHIEEPFLVEEETLAHAPAVEAIAPATKEV